MNKTAIKNYAVWARRKLLEQVEQKAFEIGITAKEIKPVEITAKDGIVINGKVYNNTVKKQREKLVKHIQDTGFEQVMEEAAYTWFNRFLALRFMEVNGYNETGTRVLSSVDPTKKEPDILSQALSINLPLDKEKIYELMDKNQSEELYKYLVITQCNVLHEPLPFMFEKIDDYMELLYPANLLNDESVIYNLVTDIPEEDWQNVEIIGWMYQYYISEKKDEVYLALKNNKKISKESIPAATQLFTPDWIVRYMVENSVGKLWLESNPSAELKAKWKFYLEPTKQEAEVPGILSEPIPQNVNPETITIFDPACGSGHILVYAFDLLYDIYKSAGYQENDIPKLILEKNLYGLDIDGRAAQMACFAVMMKAREKNRRVFRDKIEPNIYSVVESEILKKSANLLLDYSLKDKHYSETQINNLIDAFGNSKEFGSLIQVKDYDVNFWEDLNSIFQDARNEDLFTQATVKEISEILPKICKQAKLLKDTYDIVITNPPYMSRSGMNSVLTNYLDEHYFDNKSDLFSAFIDRCIMLTKKNGYTSMITMHSWMFLKSFESLRREIIDNYSIETVLHLGMEAFEGIIGKVVSTVAFTIKKQHPQYSQKIIGIRLVDFYDSLRHEKEAQFFNFKNRYELVSNEELKSISGFPVAYWVSDKVRQIFAHEDALSSIATPKKGMDTGNNERFLRFWYEVSFDKLSLFRGDDFVNSVFTSPKQEKWFPYNKGGGYRRWFGNFEYVINWENGGSELRAYPGSNLRNQDYYFRNGITWGTITSSKISFRYLPKGCLTDNGGSVIYGADANIHNLLGLLNSSIIQRFLEATNPTLNYQPGDIGKIPVSAKSLKLKDTIQFLVSSNISIAKDDWDSFETAWDFRQHILLTHRKKADTISKSFDNWSSFADKQFFQLKENEEKLNRIFIDIYGLEDEISPDVDEYDISIRRADLQRDIRSFMSYAVGCMMGRYSLDQPGLVYAGGDYYRAKYEAFPAEMDAIIPILADEYFDGEIVNRFVQFVKTVYSENHLSENLEYIANALGKTENETALERIRKYFVNDFYKDHVKMYQKRPIFWLFTSGKEKAFNALIYMHRYDKSTISRIRIDYLHELQGKLELELKRLEQLQSGDGPTRDKRDAAKKIGVINKHQSELKKYDELLRHFADQQIEIDLDDGVKVNYEKFAGLLAPIG